MNLELLANRTGIGKRSIDRIVRARKVFLQAYADWLCDRERVRRQEAGQRSGEEPAQYLIELFIDVAVELASDDHQRGHPQMSAIQFAEEMRVVRLLRSNLGQALRALLLRLAVAANAVDVDVLADTLTTLWVGATPCFVSGGDSGGSLGVCLPWSTT